MAITDIFTGKPAKDAAAASRNYYAGVQTQGNADINGGLTSATGAVSAGAAGARGDLGFGFDAATGAVNGGADAAHAAYSPLSALGTKYGGGTNLYLDSLGVNGADGNTRATSAFMPSLAYNFNRDAGIEAILRLRNKGGMANSGNADRDAQEYGAGLASREVTGWQDRLAGLINPELSATSGAASGVAGVESARGGMLADLSKWYSSGMAGIDTGEGNTLAGLNTNAAGQKVGLASSLAPAYGKTYGDAAAAQMAGSGNLWNLGLQAAKLGVGAAGGFAGGGVTSIPGGGGGGGMFGAGTLYAGDPSLPGFGQYRGA